MPTVPYSSHTTVLSFTFRQLPLISEGHYPEFFDIKFESMRLTKRAIELEVKTDEESIRELIEIKKKFEELTSRLNMVLENNYDQELLVN